MAEQCGCSTDTPARSEDCSGIPRCRTCWCRAAGTSASASGTPETERASTSFRTMGPTCTVSDRRSRYLRRGGYVFMRVSLLVSRITQKLHNRFSQNSVQRCHVGYGRNRCNLDHMVTGHLFEGSFVRNVVVQIPKFDAKPNPNPNPSPNPNSYPNPSPNPNPNPMPIRFGQMTLRTSYRITW